MNSGHGDQIVGEIKEIATSRRTLLKAGAAAVGVGALGLGGASAAQDSTASATAEASTAVACVLTPELTVGPYYLADDLVRKDITEGKAGAPLDLKIMVVDTTTCKPLVNAAVDIWHCDAQGYYSGITSENPGGGGTATSADNADTTFLRGIQLTDENGVAEFSTIFPGWYASRTTHIHMKVHEEGKVAASTDDAIPAVTGTYSGGQVSHIGQLFFDEDLTNQIYQLDAYARDSQDGRTTNEDDSVLGDHGDEPGIVVDLTAERAGSLGDGLVGTITIGVDPTANNDDTSQGQGGGAPAGGGGAPMGTPPAGGPQGGNPPGSPPSN